ncbi:MAG TPA: hypothetical protein VFN48_07115 [Solirubrobacteraceae bacterium]|nr:hypothetical protein [Solirubrobacteraceae bacterium]
MSRIRRSEAGISLSRGPALILGSVLLVAGLFFLYRVHTFPRLSQFPSAHAHTDGQAFFGIFGLNGWSGELTAAAGGLLLLGAAQHLLAKTVSFVVAVALGGVGIWALVNHSSALGLFATNIWTIVLWLAAAALLLINTRLPRRRPAPVVAPVVAPVATGEPERGVRRPITGTGPGTGTGPITGAGPGAGPITGTGPGAGPITGTGPGTGTGTPEPVTSTHGVPVRQHHLEE